MPAVTKRVAAALVVLAASLHPAGAGRAPTDEERALIKAALREQGFVSWAEIQLEDGKWEVNDARMQNGHVFDLKLEAESKRILTRDQED